MIKYFKRKNFREGNFRDFVIFCQYRDFAIFCQYRESWTPQKILKHSIREILFSPKCSKIDYSRKLIPAKKNIFTKFFELDWTLFLRYFRDNLIQQINIPRNLVPAKIISLLFVSLAISCLATEHFSNVWCVYFWIWPFFLFSLKWRRFLCSYWRIMQNDFQERTKISSSVGSV